MDYSYDRRVANQPYECLYEVVLHKPAKRGRDAGVDIVAAIHPTNGAPTEERKQGGFLSVFYVFPDGFFKQVEAACEGIKHSLEEFLKPLGAHSILADHDSREFERYARYPVPWDKDKLNFFTPRIRVPAGPTQKKNVEAIAKECVRLSSEFSHIMAVHAQMETR